MLSGLAPGEPGEPVGVLAPMLSVAQMEGSSQNTGEGCADLQEEVLLISVAVGSALDVLDGVVDAFDDAGIERVSTARQDPVQIGFEPLCEQGQGSDSATLGLFEPAIPCLLGPARAAVEPHPLQLIAHEIGGEQWLVSLQ